jgi:hypothetical protein
MRWVRIRRYGILARYRIATSNRVKKLRWSLSEEMARTSRRKFRPNAQDALLALSRRTTFP